MRNPQVGQLVWAEKITGTFVIVAVHSEQRLADLQSTEDSAITKPLIPFDWIHGLGGDISPVSQD